MRCFAVMIAIFLSISVIGVHGDEKRADNGDLVLGDNEVSFTITTKQKWKQIYIVGDVNISMSKDGTMECESITFISGNITFSSGKIIIKNESGSAMFHGKCTSLKIEHMSMEFLPFDGIGIREKSMGGDSIFRLKVSYDFIIKNVEIKMFGGDGYSKDEPWTTTLLSDRTASGGDCIFDVESLYYGDIILNNFIIDSSCGDGGDAADGKEPTGAEGGRGGGYSNGGSVSGRVGSGGYGNLLLSGKNVVMNNCTLMLRGGSGGDAGNGGDGGPYGFGGGGGGGYAGGNGGKYGVPYGSHGSDASVGGNTGSGGSLNIRISGTKIKMQNITGYFTGGHGGNAGDGGDGGSNSGGGGGGYGGGGGGGSSPQYIGYRGGGAVVFGEVGEGGDITVIFEGREICLSKVRLTLKGGDGGYAGNGGDGGVMCGGGGGGYTGGGGGGYYGGGGSGTCYGEVGSGGDVNIEFKGGIIETHDTSIYGYGGDGGSAGNGGDAYEYGGGGGGGYGGGGGAGPQYWRWYPRGGSGTVKDYVGKGGDISFRVSSDAEAGMCGFFQTSVYLKGGYGGDSGSGGKSNGQGGGGGGGLGGGGGGGDTYWNKNSKGKTNISGWVSDGGDAYISFDRNSSSIEDSCIMRVIAGVPGRGLDSPGEGSDSGGEGEGKQTRYGMKSVTIPPGVPRIMEPTDGKTLNSILPTFRWMSLCRSPTGGDVSSYYIVIDNSSEFESPIISVETYEETKFTPEPEDISNEGVYYWRVKAEYTFSNESAEWGPSYKFIYNLPPKQKERIKTQVLNEDERCEKILNLNDYFEDSLSSIKYEVLYNRNPEKLRIWIEDDFLNVEPLVKDWYGSTRVIIRAIDSQGLFTDSNPFTVRVRSVNDAPVLNLPKKYIACEDTLCFLDVLPFISDIDSHKFTIKVISDYGWVEGTVIYFLYPGDVEEEDVVVIVSDGENEVESTLHVFVDEKNDFPILREIPTIYLKEDETVTKELIEYAEDEEDGTDLRWLISGIRCGTPAIFDCEVVGKNKLKITGSKNAWGRGEIDMIVMDSDGGINSITITVVILPVNDAPVILDIPEFTIVPGKRTMLSLRAYVYDVDTPWNDLIISTDSDYVSINDSYMVIALPQNYDKKEMKFLLKVSDGDIKTDKEVIFKVHMPLSIVGGIYKIDVEEGEEAVVSLRDLIPNYGGSMAELRWTVTSPTDNFISYIDTNKDSLIVIGNSPGSGKIYVEVEDSYGARSVKEISVVVHEKPWNKKVSIGTIALFVFIGLWLLIMTVVYVSRKGLLMKGISGEMLKEEPKIVIHCPECGAESEEWHEICHSCGEKVTIDAVWAYEVGTIVSREFYEDSSKKFKSEVEKLRDSIMILDDSDRNTDDFKRKMIESISYFNQGLCENALSNLEILTEEINEEVNKVEDEKRSMAMKIKERVESILKEMDEKLENLESEGFDASEIRKVRAACKSAIYSEEYQVAEKYAKKYKKMVMEGIERVKAAKIESLKEEIESIIKEGDEKFEEIMHMIENASEIEKIRKYAKSEMLKENYEEALKYAKKYRKMVFESEERII